MEAPPVNNAKALNRFLGQIRCHSQMIRYLANVAIALYPAIHKTSFQWKTVE